VDPAYGMTAFTIEVPSGWKFAADSSPRWMPSAPVSCRRPFVHGAEPGRDVGICNACRVCRGRGQARDQYHGTEMPIDHEHDSAAGLLLNIAVPNLHPDAKKVTLLPLGKNAQDAIAAQNEKLAASRNGYGLKGGRQFTDAAKVRVEYEVKGIQWRRRSSR